MFLPEFLKGGLFDFAGIYGANPRRTSMAISPAPCAFAAASPVMEQEATDLIIYVFS